MCCYNSLLRELSASCVRENSWKLGLGFLQTTPHVPFFFADFTDFVLYLFSVINHNHTYSCLLNPDSSQQIMEFGGGLEDPNTLFFFFYSKYPLKYQCNCKMCVCKSNKTQLLLSQGKKQHLLEGLKQGLSELKGDWRSKLECHCHHCLYINNVLIFFPLSYWYWKYSLLLPVHLVFSHLAKLSY